MVIKDNELHLTYQQIYPPRKLIETPLQTGLTLHYGDLTFFANIQGNQMTITPPKGMSCKNFSSQNNCNFSDSNKPKKLPILNDPDDPQPQPQPQPKPQPQPQPQPKPSTINVDPNIYPIEQLNANVDFQGYPKEGKSFYIIDYDGQVADILVADKKQLENSFSILQQLNKMEDDQSLAANFINKNNLFFPNPPPIKPDENGNISLVKEPEGYIKNVKSNDIIVYKNGNVNIVNPDNFEQSLQLTKSGRNYIIKQPDSPDSPASKKEKSTGMSKNELYAIIFGSIGGVLLIVLIIYFLRMNKKKSQKRRK